MPDTKASADPSVTGGNIADADSLLGLFASATGTNGRLSFANLKAYLLAGLAVFGASGASQAKGLVPAPGATAGTTRFLREDATWAAIPNPAAKNNYAALVAPTSTDDANLGYEPGSSWLMPGTGDMWRCRAATAGAARWVKIDVADHPGYLAGRYYLPFGQGAVVAGIALIPGTIYLTFAIIKERISISQLGVRLTTASTGGSFQLGVYAHNLTTAGPGSFEGGTGSGSTSAATLVNLATANGQVLEAGPHWFAIQADNSTAICLAQTLASPAHMALVGDPTAAIPAGTANGSQTVGVSTPDTFGTWPADLSGATFSNVPIGRIPLIQFLVASVP